MALKVYNYLSRKLERFRPADRENVRMYVCGPTVYDHAHLGHAKTYVAMDVVVRYLSHLGYQVRYVRNFTDVGHMLDTGEDRLVRGARREGVSPMEVAERYIWSFQDDMDALGLRRPNISPRASCHIPEIIVWVQDLIDAGYAYEVAGNVYFSIERFPDYGKLARRNLDELQAGARVDVREEKRDPADFALWKRAEPEHLLRWRSPWGEGYPGWHIECSVMANKYLGKTFDIHGGGLENIFPHNDCEVAQAVAHNQAPYANYWLLVGSLLVNGQKMSKSLGNFLTVRDALKLYSPEALRYFVLSGHYRGPIEFSRDALQAAQRGVNRLHQTVRSLRRRMQMSLPSMGAGTAALADVSSLADYREDFQRAMDNDFNTPEALAVLFELVKEVNRTLEAGEASLGTLAAMDKLFRDLAQGVLGILPEDLEAEIGGPVVEELVEYLLEMRRELRQARQWSQADAIRSRLDEIGIAIEDGPHDTTWRLKRRV
ncbi:MAG: cysteine--tRNA ligase [Anaerolineae bacterium]|nr:cysteine--tRNA ligase [Anaerolineae bacterium]